MRAFTFAVFAVSLYAAPTSLYLDLGGEWRKSADDRPEYARTDFDDQAWRTIELPWRDVRVSGRYWLRRSVDLVPGGTRDGFTVRLGPVAEVYELYVNGVKIGSTGPFDENSAQVARPRRFSIPPNVVGEETRLNFAVRVLATDAFPVKSASAGGDYLLASAERVVPAARTISDIAVRNWGMLVFGCLRIFLAVVLLVVWSSERDRMELFWLAAFIAASAVNSLLTFAMFSPDVFPVALNSVRLQWNAITGVTLAELVLAWVGLRSRWLRSAVWAVWMGDLLAPTWVLYGLGNVLSFSTLLFGWWKLGGRRQPSARQWISLLLVLVILTHMNRGGAGLQGGWFGVPAGFAIGSYSFGMMNVVVTVLALVLTILLIRQLTADRREKARLAAEFEAARAIQHLLLPRPASPGGLVIDPVLYPAQEVGGDFFQVFERQDGSSLVVVGDVSGKGLRAAMVVSVIVGALRSRQAQEPAAILSELNRVLCGSLDGGFVTALAVVCSSGGKVVAASAGHLPIYVGGVETALEPGLPLGLDADSTYQETVLSLADGDQLTLISDGVVEAADRQNELFGFHRTGAVSGRPALEIADAARAWGQNDDITVVTVRRAAA